MPQPLVILDQHFRRVEELFDPTTLARMQKAFRIEGGENHPMASSSLKALLPSAEVLIAARPSLTAKDIERAPNLKAIIEVSGAFHGELDYAACFEHGIEVLSCSPGFRQSVAEMGLAMIVAGARGLVAEHEAFRNGTEAWLDDRIATDFSLFGRRIGFVGFGNIGRELHRLLKPFSPLVSFYDPWISESEGARKCDSLEELFSDNRVVVVTATPSAENRHAIGEAQITQLAPGALLVLLGRAHVIDFEVALAHAEADRITFATDVFPSEPVKKDHVMRNLPNVIFSPHRAAAVEGGRQLIGKMILHDLEAIQSSSADRMLQRARPESVAALVAAQESIEADGRLAGT